jgi:hypothetical protein
MDSKWGASHKGHEAPVAAIHELEREARAGRLDIWGRRNPNHEYEIIPPAYWEVAGLDLLRHLNPEQQVLRTEERGGLGGPIMQVPIYVGLRINEDQIKRLWTRKWSAVAKDAGRRLFPWWGI